MPALVIIVDEYAELAEQAPAALKHTDTIARLGRAPAVTLVLATQRPTQKVMGHSAVRSQMNIRISFRVEEQRDVDLVLGQGKLSDRERPQAQRPRQVPPVVTRARHPRRARAYLLTDADVTGAAARYAPARPPLDAISRRALTAPPAVPPDGTEPGGPGQDAPSPAHSEDIGNDEDGPESILQSALSRAPDQGISVSELMAATGMGRRWVYYRLRELSAAGRVIQTARGLWRIAPQGGNRE